MLAPGIQSSAPHQSDRPPLSSAQGARLECCRSHQFRRIRIGQLAKTPDCPGRQLKQETKPGNNQERYIHIIQEISKSFGVQLKKIILCRQNVSSIFSIILLLVVLESVITFVFGIISGIFF